MITSNSHTGGQGKTIVEKIQGALDRASVATSIPEERAFAEGIAYALSILRSTTTQEEMDLSSDRISGVYKKDVVRDPMHDPWRNK